MKSGLTSDDKDSTFRRELENNTKPKPDPLHFLQKGDTLTAPFGRSSLASDAATQLLLPRNFFLSPEPSKFVSTNLRTEGTNLKTDRTDPVLIGPKMDPKHIRNTINYSYWFVIFLLQLNTTVRTEFCNHVTSQFHLHFEPLMMWKWDSREERNAFFYQYLVTGWLVVVVHINLCL